MGDGAEIRLVGAVPGGTMARPGEKAMAQLKCIYTNARSMGNKQEDLEAIVQQAGYDLVAITETGYKLFRRDRKNRRGGGVALYIRESFDVVELEAGNDKVESLSVRIGGKANKASVLVGVCYRPPNQDEETDEEFYGQLTEVAKSSALVLEGDFNFPDISWKHKTAQTKQSRRFLESMKDSFLTQLVTEPTRGGAPLDPLFTNREGLVGDVAVGSCLGQSDHEMVEFSILGKARKGNNKTAVLDFQRADFELFRTLVGRVPWEAVLKGRGVQEVWALFKKEILMAQEWSVPTCPKTSWRGRRPAWLNRELHLELRRKKRVYNLWKKRAGH
ncbi:uncharacterized protein [Anas acuta]|uniref:uncharacterized protein n=1 Tax=Anas acuta TaxID=28680 RepID=UPI0035C91DDD